MCAGSLSFGALWIQCLDLSHRVACGIHGFTQRIFQSRSRGNGNPFCSKGMDLTSIYYELNWVPSGYLTVRHGKLPIEIDGLPIKNGGSFHGELLVITRWYMIHGLKTSG